MENLMQNLQTGLVVSLIGIILVVGVLSLISFILSLLKYLPKKIEPEKLETVHEEATVIQEGDDLQLVAVITAAIAQATGKPVTEFRIMDIKKETGWINAAGAEQLSKFTLRGKSYENI